MKELKSTVTQTGMIDLGNTMLCMQVIKGVTTSLVIQSHEYVVVTDRYITVHRNVPLIKLAKVFSTPDEAYEEWLHVIGKLCKKKSTSKYFDNPNWDEHLVNGKFKESQKKVISDIALTAVRLING